MDEQQRGLELPLSASPGKIKASIEFYLLLERGSFGLKFADANLPSKVARLALAH
jgi:hypothetical protein